MSYATAPQHGVPHAAFLRHLAGASSASSAEGRLGQGAFLALRLVDLLAEPQGVYADAFRYQHAATERFCRQLPADCTETAHLVGLVQNAADAFRAQDVGLVAPALVAYAHCLEDGLRLDQALDVLDTLLYIGRERLGSADATATHLRIGRVNRKLNRFDQADAAYDVAAKLADAAGDIHSALLSRAGHAISLQGRGNLAAAEQVLRQIAAEAQRCGERDVAAGVQHALGTTLLLRGQVAEGILHVWRAFEFYEDEATRLRALNDIGIMLLALGRVDDAERALSEVVRRGGARDNVSNAMIELMHCASHRRDRVGFERRRTECESRGDEMPPNIRADFYLKAGIGSARFGNFSRAHALLKQALEIAVTGGLHELEFRLERIMTGLRDCETEVATERCTDTEPAISTEALQQVSASLTRLER